MYNIIVVRFVPTTTICDVMKWFHFLQGTAPSSLVWILYSIFIAIIFLVIKYLNYRLHLMFDGEEIRTESEQQDQEVRSGESGAERDESSRVEVSSGPVKPGGEVIELEVINRCSQDAANEGGEENVTQPSTTSALSTSQPPSSSSLLLNPPSRSVATAARPHQVQLLSLITVIFACSL